MIRLLAFLALLAAPAIAETARVISGEHADFTRLVVELPAGEDWTLGRTAMGYAFATGSASQPAYDLSRVWQRIPRTRLQALRSDPQTGVLNLMLACLCHVFPFEYRPGMIVLDIKPGPAPPGSAFEQPFAARDSAFPRPPVSVTPARKDPQDYDWLERTGATLPPTEGPALALDSGPVSLDPLRQELLEQISRGAAEGVVDMELPGKSREVAAVDNGVLPWAQIRIGEMPGLTVTDPKAANDPLLPDGSACIADDLLALPDWGDGRPPLDLLVEARSDLFGEFDVVTPEAVLQAIRLHLYLGFGAEAGQYAAMLKEEQAPEELALYRSLARLIDGETDPNTPFVGMLTCDGTVALWSALAYTRLPKGQGVNTDAVLRSFLALPPHLRGSLGPGLAEKLLESGDADAARMIRDALARTPGLAAGPVALLDATADLQAGRPDAARAHAEAAIAEDGTNAPALATLVEAHFREAKPLSPEVAESLRAFLGEAGDHPENAALQRALVLALALSGQTDAAFATAETLGVPVSDLWQIAHSLADDDAFLRHAVLPAGGSVPLSTPETQLAVAIRLLDLGFADAGLVWLGPVAPSDPPAKRRAAARAELARGDARSAIDLLDGLADPSDAALRAAALVQLGSFPAARQAYDAAGMPDESLRLLAWEKDWRGLQADGPLAWAEAVDTVAQGVQSGEGPLARGAALLEDSAKARAAVDALLSSVAAPAAQPTSP